MTTTRVSYKGTNPNQNLPLCQLQLVADRAPTSAHDGLDPLQLALVVFLSTNTSNLPSWWSSPATCIGVLCMPIATCPLTGVLNHIWLHNATCIVWRCLWFVFYTCMCGVGDVDRCVCACSVLVLASCIVCSCMCLWTGQANKQGVLTFIYNKYCLLSQQRNV